MGFIEYFLVLNWLRWGFNAALIDGFHANIASLTFSICEETFMLRESRPASIMFRLLPTVLAILEAFWSTSLEVLQRHSFYLYSGICLKGFARLSWQKGSLLTVQISVSYIILVSTNYV